MIDVHMRRDRLTLRRILANILWACSQAGLQGARNAPAGALSHNALVVISESSLMSSSHQDALCQELGNSFPDKEFRGVS